MIPRNGFTLRAKPRQAPDQPHNPRNRHGYMTRPTRRVQQLILIAVAGNELRPQWDRWLFTHSATGTSTVKDQLFAYLRTAIEKQLLKDVACAGREARGVSATRATWWGGARAPVAAIWCARPLPISH